MKTSFLIFFTAAIFHFCTLGQYQEPSLRSSENGNINKVGSKSAGPYFGQISPGNIPKRFAASKVPPGAWAITFSPDGLECFISQNVNNLAVIKTSRETGGTWPDLSTAGFSGTYWDMESHITPDGTRMYFGSERPLTGFPQGKLYQWYLDRTDSGWSEPHPMDTPLKGIFMMYPSVADNKNMYFTGGDGSTICYIARSQYVNGTYQPPEILSDSINYLDWPAHPFVARDESYIMFDATDSSTNSTVLFISFHKPDGTWTKAKKLPSNINPSSIPYVSRDGKYFFFWKNAANSTWWVNAGFIETLRPLAGPYLGQSTPDTVPLRFAPPSLQANSTWFWHGSPSFSPDLKEMFFVKYIVSSNKTEINYMKMNEGVWGDPARPSFTNTMYIENNPVFSPSGDTVYFYSQRPGGPYFYVVRQPGSWSDPIPLHIPYPDTLTPSWQFFIARDKTFYFDLWQKQGDIDIYTSEFVNGAYAEPVKLGPEINTPYQDWGAAPDPGEQVMIFPSNKPGGAGLHDLYRSVKKPDGSWSETVNLGNNINSANEDGFPSFTPDGKYFFFTTARQGDLGYNPYWVKAEAVAPSLGVDERKRGNGNIILNQNFPNPCSSETKITFQTSNYGPVSIALYNLYGKFIMKITEGEMKAGEHTLNINVSSLAPGMYFYSLISSDKVITRQIIIFR
jgi:hypothetical protein